MSNTWLVDSVHHTYRCESWEIQGPEISSDTLILRQVTWGNGKNARSSSTVVIHWNDVRSIYEVDSEV